MEASELQPGDFVTCMSWSDHDDHPHLVEVERVDDTLFKDEPIRVLSERRILARQPVAQGGERLMTNPLPEPHYTARTLAECWCLDVSTIIDWFSGVPGVLKLQPKKPRNGARTRCEIRIPRSVAERVYNERTK